MLKLKRVELQGFKSFCDRTELRFQGDGVAAIVGPNGCGKSNISDAISWVLGEQSAKTLRGTRMEDVIFAGTNDRKPVGMAYVTMTLVDPELYHEGAAHKLQAVEGALPHGPAEVTITVIEGRLISLPARLVHGCPGFGCIRASFRVVPRYGLLIQKHPVGTARRLEDIRA